MRKEALPIMGVLTGACVSQLLPSGSVAVDLGATPETEALMSNVLSENAMPAGLKNWLSAPSFRATPVWPMPICLVRSVLT